MSRVTSSLPSELYPGLAHEHFAGLALVRFVESFMNLMRIASFTAVDGWHAFPEYLVHYIPAELVETSVCFVFFLDDGCDCNFSRLGPGFTGMATPSCLVYRDKSDKFHRAGLCVVYMSPVMARLSEQYMTIGLLRVRLSAGYARTALFRLHACMWPACLGVLCRR